MDFEELPYISATAVAALANDLRATLRVIVSGLDAIRGHVPQTPQIDQTLADLDSAIDAAFYVGREMLALAQPARTEPTLIDLNELVAHAREMVERVLGDAIRLSLNLSATAPVIKADLVQLEWVLLNLAWNAADSMPNGGRVRIETVSIDIPPDIATDGTYKGRHHVRLTVSDTGSGMSPDVRNRAVEPFFSTRTGKTGLGLTSASITVRRLGGSLRLRDNSPQGTSVDIYLPVQRTPPQNG
jgi:signal transduction histidine kinase